MFFQLTVSSLCVMFKAIKRLITSGLKPHSCKLCNSCYVCHGCLRERNQIRQCCFGVTEDELDVLHEELKNNFSLIYPVRKHLINAKSVPAHSHNNDDYPEKCRSKSGDFHSFQCNICKKVFKTEFTLTRHFNAHAKVGEKFKCETCNVCFAINRDLRSHCKLHKDVENKSRVCMYCEKELSSCYYLKIHMRRHTGERPFKCELCNCGFTTRSTLNIHYRTHAIERNACKESISNELTDSEAEMFVEENDSLNGPDSFILRDFEPERSFDEISGDEDFISNFGEPLNLEHFSDTEVSKQNIALSLNESLYLDQDFEVDVNTQSYKAPLVIKLKPLA